MKKIKAVSLILAASMLLSMTGCSSKKKELIQTADSYAQALLEADVDDMAEFMVDDDEFEEAVESYLDRYAKKQDLEDIFDFVLENMTYEIDKKSIGITDKKAAIRINYTMVDYMVAYEDLDEDADVDDFLDALEDTLDAGDTITIVQKLEFRLVKDEWKIDDEDFENTFDVYEFYQEISDLGFGKLKPYTCDEVKDILIDLLDADDDDLYIDESYSSEVLSYYGNSVNVQVFTYGDSDDASDGFEIIYDTFVDLIDDDDFDGECSYDFDGETGYILLDGTIHTDYSDEYSYGGIYFVEDTFIVIATERDSSSSKDDVDAIINALGYPTP